MANPLNLTLKQMQSQVLNALRHSGRGRLARRSILAAVAALSGNKLSHRDYQKLKAQMNSAIGALLRRKSPVIKKSPRTPDVLLLVKRKTKRTVPTRRQIVMKVMPRITAVQFKCAKCEKSILVNDFEMSDPCACGAHYI